MSVPTTEAKSPDEIVLRAEISIDGVLTQVVEYSRSDIAKICQEAKSYAIPTNA